MSDREQYIVDLFLEAYRHGAFPMAEPAHSGGRSRGGGAGRPRRIDWFIPDPRAVIELHGSPTSPHDLGGFHIPRSLDRKLRKRPYRITSNQAFEQVIRGCAEPAPGRDDTWIDDSLIAAYCLLHRRGFAHSVEAWLDRPNKPPRLVGGVYGLALGAAFCAESMFSRPDEGGTDASKVALAYLVRHLRDRGFLILDVQIRNHHTDQFGVVEIPAANYLKRLGEAMPKHTSWGMSDPNWDRRRPNT